MKLQEYTEKVITELERTRTGDLVNTAFQSIPAELISAFVFSCIEAGHTFGVTWQLCALKIRDGLEAVAVSFQTKES